MGGDVAEVGNALHKFSEFKVHSSMCWELTKILDKIIRILPAIEAARPGCKAGIQELCSLNNTIEKAKLLLQHCAESSKLYLAITGEATVLRCERIRSALDQSLSLIQNMVPPLLADQITKDLNDLRDAKFTIDFKEEEAGKAILEILRQTNSTEESELETFQIAASRLNITSPKALLIERRSVKKLLDKFHGADPKKERILSYFLYILKKYGKQTKPETCEHKENITLQDRGWISSTNSACNVSNSENNDDPTDHGEAQSDLCCSDVPPEEFKCPISSTLMYDPVVIDSGQTYERIWIEKWFNEGHDTCPKTQKKLSHLSMIPNSCMKDLVLQWCRNHGINVQDPCSEPKPAVAFHSLESSHFNSISSLKNVSALLLDGNTRDYMLQSDYSNVSIPSDASYCSDSSHVRGIESLKDNHTTMFSWSDDYKKCQSFSNFSHDTYLRFFHRLSELPLECQCKAVEDVKFLLKNDEETCHIMLYNGFADALMMFLKNAYDLSDVQAQKTGAQILLAFLSNSRTGIPSLSEDAFQLLSSFLDSEITKEALMILQMLSSHPNGKSTIAASGVPPSITNILDSQVTEFVEMAVWILCDLSSHNEIRSQILSSGCISKLVPLLNNRRLAESCIKILRNLSYIEEAAATIAETDGCLASIVELLDTGSREEQEHAVVILHSVCSDSFENCLRVMKEGVIPSLVDISVNGSPQGKETAMKLLYILRDLRHNDCFDSSVSQSRSNSESAEEYIVPSIEKQQTSKSYGFFRRKIRFFAKPRSLALV